MLSLFYNISSNVKQFLRHPVEKEIPHRLMYITASYRFILDNSFVDKIIIV